MGGAKVTALKLDERKFEMVIMKIEAVAKSRLAMNAADEINRLAASNGFSTPENDDELYQYRKWFEDQMEECDDYIQRRISIKVEEIEIEE